MSFARDVEAWTKKAGISTDEAVRSINLTLLKLIVEKIPVDLGETQANTFTSLGAPSSLVNGGKGDPVKRGANDVRNSPGNVFYITNNKPWIKHLEFGLYGTGPGATQKTTRDGYSIQAPNGMFRISVMEVRAGIRDLIK